MPTTTLTTATLQLIGKQKPSKYEGKPNYRPCLFKMPDGSERWKAFQVGAEELTWLKKGQTYQATLTGDDFTLINPKASTSPPQPQAQSSSEVTPEAMAAAKKAIAQNVTEMANLYGFCYGEAKRVLEDHQADSQAVAGCAFRLWHHAKDQLR